MEFEDWFWNCNEWLFSLRQVIRSHNELGQAATQPGISAQKKKSMQRVSSAQHPDRGYTINNENLKRNSGMLKYEHNADGLMASIDSDRMPLSLMVSVHLSLMRTLTIMK